MKAGLIPGYTDINQLYVGYGHLTNVGSYIMGLTQYATMYKESPAGMAIPVEYVTGTYYDQWHKTNLPAIAISAEQSAALQEAVWHVVSTYSYSAFPSRPPGP
jgi:hypothetical protein